MPPVDTTRNLFGICAGSFKLPTMQLSWDLGVQGAGKAATGNTRDQTFLTLLWWDSAKSRLCTGLRRVVWLCRKQQSVRLEGRSSYQHPLAVESELSTKLPTEACTCNIWGVFEVLHKCELPGFRIRRRLSICDRPVHILNAREARLKRGKGIYKGAVGHSVIQASQSARKSSCKGQ